MWWGGYYIHTQHRSVCKRERERERETTSFSSQTDCPSEGGGAHVPPTVLPGLVQAQLGKPATSHACWCWLECLTSMCFCLVSCPCVHVLNYVQPWLINHPVFLIADSNFACIFCVWFVLFSFCFSWTSPYIVQYYVLIFWQWLRPTRSMYSIFNHPDVLFFLALD